MSTTVCSVIEENKYRLLATAAAAAAASGSSPTMAKGLHRPPLDVPVSVANTTQDVMGRHSKTLDRAVQCEFDDIWVSPTGIFHVNRVRHVMLLDNMAL
ncbi:hypothetical protein PoB_000439000 [Plakobranchus ocellatus]|uniref:Uncharacterized protein n=1 Tax=Plakobranchus ocellatus TaxID=259542 RepID=A0AAV3Y4A0_9GAST|nr:hypothetical protein PoB_000439000 [Plakobranchus ocellatus]